VLSPGNAGRTGTSQHPNSKMRGSKAAKNSSIRTAKHTSRLSVNRIRSGIAVSPAGWTSRSSRSGPDTDDKRGSLTNPDWESS
jgi:hypothetical protein